MTAAEIARELDCDYRDVLALVGSGHIPAKRGGGTGGRKGPWNVAPADFEKLKRRNIKKIAKLKAEFVRLYWEGLDHYALQDRVAEEFAKRGILCRARGFAEIAIYEDLMKSKRKEETA